MDVSYAAANVTDKNYGVGEVSSLHFDGKSGRIIHYEMSGGLFKDLVNGKGLLSRDGDVSLGSDMLVIQETATGLSELIRLSQA